MGSVGDGSATAAAPAFVRKPQLRQEDEGNRLIFECKLSGMFEYKLYSVYTKAPRFCIPEYTPEPTSRDNFRSGLHCKKIMPQFGTKSSI
jgi:hypothetical protein